MKKILCIFVCILLIFSISACKKEEAPRPELVEEKFITISSYQEGDIEDIRKYTVNVAIDQSGKVIMYADNFKKWYDQGECPILELQITKEQVDGIKETIEKYDFYSLNENIGNRDMTDGEVRRITVQTTDNTYSTYGLNISNRRFDAIYEAVLDTVREQYYRYVSQINLIQEAALEEYNRRGISVYDTENHELITDEDIVAFEKVKASEGPNLTLSTDTDAVEEDDLYCIYFTITDKGKEKLASRDYDDEIVKLLLYVDGYYAYNMIVNYSVDKKIYLNILFEEEDAAKKTEELNQKLVR